MTANVSTSSNGITEATARAVAQDPANARVIFRASGVPEGTVGGFQAVRVTVRSTGPQTAERGAELQRAVDAHCPVLDLSTAPTPVETTLITA